MGTKIWLGGGTGWVIGAGTQHAVRPARNERGLPLTAAGTLMLKGDMKGMNPKWVRGVSILGYGCSLSLGVGIPIPILDEDMAFFTGVSDADITMPVRDYGQDYPNGVSNVLAQPTFEELKSGEIEVAGRKVNTVPLTSYAMSLEIAQELKKKISKGKFLLTEAQDKIESE
jgi:uncharacterized protein (DUF39 family)